jgi:hypothetical protein
MHVFKRCLALVPLLALLTIVSGLPAAAFGDGGNDFRARFRGLDENPSINTDASGSLRVQIHGSGSNATIDYTLTYTGLAAPVTQSHIHFANARVNGGIVIWLCQTAASPAPASVAAVTPTCPGPSGGTVTRTVHPSDVVAVTAQGVTAGDLQSVIDAMREGATYGNVHSQQFPGGEIRGQLRAG